MNNNKQNEWMEKLVKNYRLPDEKETEKKQPIRLLKESQLKIILNKDKEKTPKK